MLTAWMPHNSNPELRVQLNPAQNQQSFIGGILLLVQLWSQSTELKNERGNCTRSYVSERCQLFQCHICQSGKQNDSLSLYILVLSALRPHFTFSSLISNLQHVKSNFAKFLPSLIVQNFRKSKTEDVQYCFGNTSTILISQYLFVMTTY